MQQPQSLLSFSDQMYQRFLRAYPVEYRQGFSEEMAQVFRDLCRDIYEREGLAGFLELWLTTLFDLLKTALEERFKETYMTKEKFVRLSGWALMLAGVTLLLGFAISGIPAANFDRADDPLAEYNYFYDPFGGEDVLFEAASIILIPSAMMFLSVGMYGLRARYGEGSGKLGNNSLLISAAAAAAGFLATIFMSIFSDEIWWTIWVYSMLAMFTGLLVFGIAAMQKRLLPRWNALPILVGIWFPVLFLSEQFGANLDNFGFLGGAILWIDVIGMIALGYLLQGDVGEEMATA